jgi:hypothetical protein
MKRKLFLIVAACYSLFFYGCEKEEAVPETELPPPAKEFISNHFAAAAIAKVVKEEAGRSVSYEVALNNGLALEFDATGACTEIDGNTNRLPDGLIPAPILQYVQANYASDFIVGWEIDGAEQEVELASKAALRFDQDHNFLRLDQ